MDGIGAAEVAKYWDKNSAVWADQVRKGYDIYRESFNNPSIFALAGDVTGKRILDAGCGEEYNTRKLAKLGTIVVGIDISPRMIQLAREEETRSHLGIDYQLSSFSEMSTLSDSQFDMVISFMALMDGPDYPAAIRQIHRVLKIGGALVFSVTHPCFMTPGLRWARDESGQDDRLVLGDYFGTEAYIDRWKFSHSPEANDLPEFEIPYFLRTLSEFINPLLETGFRLVRIRNPSPTKRHAGNILSYLNGQNMRRSFCRSRQKRTDGVICVLGQLPVCQIGITCC